MLLDQPPLYNQANSFENLYHVTPFSKYLAMSLFVLLPFIGGWIGFELAHQDQVNQEVSLYEEVPNQGYKGTELNSPDRESYGARYAGGNIDSTSTVHAEVDQSRPRAKLSSGANVPDTLMIGGEHLFVLSEHGFSWQGNPGRVLHVCGNQNWQASGYPRTTYPSGITRDGKNCIHKNKLYIDFEGEYQLIDEQLVEKITDLRELHSIQFTQDRFDKQYSTTSQNVTDLLMLNFKHEPCEVAFSELCHRRHELTHLVSLSNMAVTKYETPFLYGIAYVGGHFIWNQSRTAFVLTYGDLGGYVGYGVYKVNEHEPVVVPTSLFEDLDKLNTIFWVDDEILEVDGVRLVIE